MRTSKSRLGRCLVNWPRTARLYRRFGRRVAAFLEGSQICPALSARRLPHLKVTSAPTWLWEVAHAPRFLSCFACFSSDWAAKNELAPLARIHETLDKGTQNCRLTWRPKRGLSRRPRAAGRSPGQLAAGRASAAVSAARHARARVETSDQGKAAGRNGERDSLQYVVRRRASYVVEDAPRVAAGEEPREEPARPRAPRVVDRLAAVLLGLLAVEALRRAAHDAVDAV